MLKSPCSADIVNQDCVVAGRVAGFVAKPENLILTYVRCLAGGALDGVSRGAIP